MSRARLLRRNRATEFFSSRATLAISLFFDVPNGQNATGLSETSLLLDTTDALLQDGGDLGGLGLGLGGVGTDLLGGTGEGAGNSRADLEREREKLVNGVLLKPICDEVMFNGCAKGRDRIRGPIELEFEMESVGQGDSDEDEDDDGQDGIGLTEATRPVAETAATERLDCRRAFLNIVRGGVQRMGGWNSLKERCNWGEEFGEEREGCGRVGRESFVGRGEARILRTRAKLFGAAHAPMWP